MAGCDSDGSVGGDCDSNDDNDDDDDDDDDANGAGADDDIGDDENDNDDEGDDDDNYLSNTSSAVLASPMSPISPLLESNSTDEEKSMAVSLQRVDINLANRYADDSDHDDYEDDSD